MRRFLSVTFLLVCISMSAQDWTTPEMESLLRTYVKQIYELHGRVFGVDEFSPDPFPLQGANIKMTCLADTTVFDGSTVDGAGYFWATIGQRKRFDDTRVRIEISYLGMEKFDSVFSPPKEKQNGVDTYSVSLDSLVLHSLPMTVREVEIVAELKRMYQRGDTVIFNADAFELPTGSVLLDLVRRLPGLQYQDGRMTYLGRDIEEIRLNGDEFFKRDMSIALNNMPASKLKSLNVYEVKDDTLKAVSDNHLVMDMKTDEPVDISMFASASAGTDEKFSRYSLSADASVWKKEGSEFWVSFGTSDIPDEYSYELESDRTNGNLSYYREWGNLSVGASGGFNLNSSAGRNENLSRLFMPEYTQNSYSESESSNSSRSMSGNMWLNGKAGRKTSWNANMSMSGNRNTDSSSSTDSIWDESAGLVSSTMQTNSSQSQSRNVNLFATVYHSFGKGDRYNLNSSVSYSHGDGTGTAVNSSESRFVQLGDSVRRVRHRILTPQENSSVRADVGLERQLGKDGNGGFAEMSYSVEYTENSSVQYYADILDDGGDRAVDSLHYDKSDSRLEHGLTVRYYYSDSIRQVTLSGWARPVRTAVDNLQYGKDEHLKQNGVRFNGSANLRFKVFRKSRLGLQYSCSNGLPDASQLSTVTDYSDPMNVRSGNSSLKNSFSQNGTVEFQLQSWMRTTFSMGNTFNQITTLTRLDRLSGARHTSPANINGAWNMREYLYLTYPFSDISAGLTVSHSLNHNVSYVQSYTDASPQTSATDWHQTDFRLSGAYSDASWMVETGAAFSMDRSRSDYLSTSDGGKRISAEISVTYETEFGLGIGSDCSYERPFGYKMESANRTECIWNATASYRFLKQKQAVLSVQWRDILNSCNGFSASMNGTSWNESRLYGETSLFLITFSYRLSQFD